jgi:carboxymethylenebutenolidase
MSEELIAETVGIEGNTGDEIEAYRARPLGGSTRGGVVVIHHMPGFDRGSKEIVRRFASMGFDAICPNLYSREAPGASPDDAAALVRSRGGVPDERLLGDVAGASNHLRSLPQASGRVGVIGYCSGGRQSLLSACSLKLEAAVVCYGAFLMRQPPEGAPVHMSPVGERVAGLACPVLGLFGAEDQYPSPDEVSELDAKLTELGKAHEFHTYAGAGHAFFNVDRDSYRVEAAQDGWRRIAEFFGNHLS